ncbi:MAG: hypothetical protein ACRDF0_03880 [Candidatus Limnocylindria bacterium]
MSEYDLVCDACARALEPAEAVVAWTRDGDVERGFVLAHAACVPAAATQRAEVGRLVRPNEYLAFVTERFGRTIAEAEPLRAIVWALAPFVMRHDNPSEMDSMRAASFGQRLGVKPGSAAVASPQKAAEIEGGK